MTRVLRPIAANQPFTPLIEAMRGLWMGYTSTGASVGHEALLAVVYFGGHPHRHRLPGQLALPAPHGRPLTRDQNRPVDQNDRLLIVCPLAPLRSRVPGPAAPGISARKPRLEGSDDFTI